MRETVKDREVSKGVVVNRGRCGGNPTVKGTRITAHMLANMLSGPRPISAEYVIENYRILTYADIANVKAWDRKGRPE